MVESKWKVVGEHPHLIEQVTAAGAVACAGRDCGVACAVVRQRLTCWLALFAHRGLLRLGVKRFQNDNSPKSKLKPRLAPIEQPTS